MTTVISEVYEAFRAAGVSEYKTRQAAEALSAENLATKQDIEELKANNRLFKWMLGFNLTFALTILWKIFS